MNRRIRYIFWLMTCCIVAINAFQAYWLWKTYELNRQQFGRSVQDALFNVLERRQVAEASLMVDPGGETRGTKSPEGRQRILIRRYDSSGDSGLRLFYKKGVQVSDSSGKQEVKEERNVVYGVKTKQKGGVSSVTDTLARRISDLVVQGWSAGDHVDLDKFRQAYQAELLRREISFAFELDTVTIKPQHAEGDMLFFNSNMVKSGKFGELQTAPLLINPVRHLFVRAVFPSPTPYLLKQMGWLLGSSMLLLILTTGCFLFMLTTILRQKKLSEIKSSFINNMTHELKTPIATVTAAVDALRNFGALEDPRKTNTYLEISQNNLQRLSDLVEKVLNLAVEEKSELVLQCQKVNLAELANSLVTNHQLRSSKSVSFDMNIPPGITVAVDPLHFSNVINNLIDNAINYSYSQVKVLVNFKEHAKGWQLSVSDNGIGIPKTYQSAVFEKFFRVPTGDLHAVKGFGLGLAYVKQVVELHGGRVTVHSEPGKGSEFILEF